MEKSERREIMGSSLLPLFPFQEISLVQQFQAHSLASLSLLQPTLGQNWHKWNYPITHLNLWLRQLWPLAARGQKQDPPFLSLSATKLNFALCSLLQKLHEYNQDDPVEVPVPPLTVNPSNMSTFTVNAQSDSPWGYWSPLGNIQR